MLRILTLIFITSLLCLEISAQVGLEGDIAAQLPADTLSSDTLDYITFIADVFNHWVEDGHELDSLIGDVKMIQDSLFMYCDEAFMVDQLYVDAYHNVVIIHEDSIQIFADTGAYNGVVKVAELFGDVVLQEGGRSVYTKALTYNIGTKQADYAVGGTLVEGDRKIVSLKGHYNTELREAILSGNVRYQDSSVTMLTDSILYYSDAEQLVIVQPTKINQDSVDIYCEAGVYRLKVKQGVLSSNVQVKTAQETITSGILNIDGENEKYTFWIDPVALVPDGKATADTIIYYKNEEVVELIGNAKFRGEENSVEAPFIRYDLKTEEYSTEGRANVVSGDNIIKADDISSGPDGGSVLTGHVDIQDLEAGTIIRSDNAIMQDSIMKVYSEGKQAEMDYIMSEDTLYLKADTLMSIESYPQTDSASQVYYAVDKVSLITKDVSGRSGYFTYSKSDSIIIMTDDPVLWADSVQLSADTIMIHLTNNSVSRIDQIGNAFILSPDANVNFNQIKCKHIRNVISDGKIDTTFASRNVELCYLVLQENEYQAVNITHLICMNINLGWTFGNIT